MMFEPMKCLIKQFEIKILGYLLFMLVLRATLKMNVHKRAWGRQTADFIYSSFYIYCWLVVLPSTIKLLDSSIQRLDSNICVYYCSYLQRFWPLRMGCPWNRAPWTSDLASYLFGSWHVQWRDQGEEEEFVRNDNHFIFVSAKNVRQTMFWKHHVISF